MKLNSAQIEHTLNQLDGEAIPAEHPMLSQLERLFGEHTYFLDSRGLNIVEPVDAEEADGRLAVVVNLADWAELERDEPEAAQTRSDGPGGRSRKRHPALNPRQGDPT